VYSMCWLGVLIAPNHQKSRWRYWAKRCLLSGAPDAEQCHKMDNQDFSHRFLRCLPLRFNSLVTIIVRDGLEGVITTRVLGDVVT
jgi:hypothetical protein